MPDSPGSGSIDRTRRALGVYVHFPFCVARCPYCDFAVDPRRGTPDDVYADAVLAELAARRGWFLGSAGAPAAPLASIYFGGGTPGLWRPDQVARVIAGARAAFEGHGELEITLECNPGEVDAAHLEAVRRAGVNRVSFGVQSFDDDVLRAIGRRHDGRAAVAAIGMARQAGFDNVCADLMYGLPGQSLDGYLSSVERLAALGPEHITAYALTVVPGTPFGSLERAGRLQRPDDEQTAAMFERGRDLLESAGFLHYEVSSYSRPGRRSRHNSLYWTGQPYLGLGASAASFRPLDDGTAWRWSNPRSTGTYLRDVERRAGDPTPVHVERRSGPALENEALWLALRMTDGVDRAAHRARHGVDPVASREPDVRRCVAAGWLELDDRSMRLTRPGFLFADEVATRLWRDEDLHR